jgi:hypothetical protein
MRLKKQSLREIRDAALAERIATEGTAARIREIIDNPLKPVPRYVRGALVKPTKGN